MLWATLNTLLIISYLVGGTLDVKLAKDVGVILPFLAAGIVVGELVHKKVNDLIFRKLVFGVLLITGIFMLIA